MKRLKMVEDNIIYLRARAVRARARKRRGLTSPVSAEFETGTLEQTGEGSRMSDAGRRCEASTAGTTEQRMGNDVEDLRLEMVRFEKMAREFSRSVLGDGRMVGVELGRNMKCLMIDIWSEFNVLRSFGSWAVVVSRLIFCCIVMLTLTTIISRLPTHETIEIQVVTESQQVEDTVSRDAAVFGYDPQHSTGKEKSINSNSTSLTTLTPTTLSSTLQQLCSPTNKRLTLALEGLKDIQTKQTKGYEQLANSETRILKRDQDSFFRSLRDLDKRILQASLKFSIVLDVTKTKLVKDTESRTKSIRSLIDILQRITVSAEGPRVQGSSFFHTFSPSSQKSGSLLEIAEDVLESCASLLERVVALRATAVADLCAYRAGVDALLSGLTGKQTEQVNNTGWQEGKLGAEMGIAWDTDLQINEVIDLLEWSGTMEFVLRGISVVLQELVGRLWRTMDGFERMGFLLADGVVGDGFESFPSKEIVIAVFEAEMACRAFASSSEP